MSLRSVTERIDNIIFAAVAIIALALWTILGFPFVIGMITAAVLAVIVFGFLQWMESTR
jgi:hypothetical protein